ncbi:MULTISPECIES: nickel-dependent hydrogenase large subunit [Aminobacterium]|jgi:membrane-bound hydrogenase subunit alpha|uniref:NADH dehydrogenase (Quinone) n=1 Tax=Aminobacterium colombiense (strain DSM 12261 / ALA-1) TaxID=572547 RepID=D5EFQ3_AMICL|nr:MULTISPECIES: nickel-dependent hydrogenase large subunit [Aminobacterium]MDD2379635.1 nickel-dependent hydrogenase large subunit [Aminobacterium colombiense]ADE57385.1 NADH dehydrogenase (quinone) [Aminobacterium colombiense DSM 12261]MDD3768179.1 nickel-dependent hydrogenase large subunit [Aminobacterium colombiense]MDD4265488.1 nickel-dependent hydrogenase large subunit [Aminobacterium colombiense]MDD4585531.1 nickel-dependent hydrogenase large subunit [Aminobacterium colombiense]
MASGKTQTYKVPIGPVHVGLKEPITAWLDLDGEKIVDARVRPGAIHRGIEFMARERNPIQIIYLAERICGICSFSHITAFLRAVEDAAQIQVPPRAQYIRALVLELERVHSHALWAGVACYSIGFDSAFHLGMVLREKVMDVLESYTGNRVNYGVGTVGGVRWDLTPETVRVIKEMIQFYRDELGAFYDVVTEDPVAHARMRNVGILTYEEAMRYCALGPTARASGVRCDLRWSSPYEAYADLDVKPVVPQDYFGKAYGDVFDRFLVRVLELYQSLDILEKIIEGLPEGDIVFEKSLVKVLNILKAADGEGWSSIEAPRGDDTHVVQLKGGQENVYWWKVRAPTYSNAVSWPIMFRNNELADAPLIINSIDPCISCMERTLITGNSEKAGQVYSKNQLLEMSREKTRRLKKA